MSTWNLMLKLHQKMFRKIQLLEEASLDLLAKKVAYEETEKVAKDFVEFFRVAVIQHFKIEEEALFSMLKRNFKDAKLTISELISEHKIMINNYFKIQEDENSKLSKMEDLRALLKDLSEHARKEEENLPSFIELLDEEQLKKIDELTRQFGCRV